EAAGGRAASHPAAHDRPRHVRADHGLPHPARCGPANGRAHARHPAPGAVPGLGRDADEVGLARYAARPGRCYCTAVRAPLRQALVYAGLTPFLVVALFPVLWMTITAFKHERELYAMRGVPFWLHEGPTLKHFHLLFTQTWFGSWVVNTALVSALVVVITVVVAVPAGYALARLRLPGGGPAAVAIFVTYLVPPIVLFLPLAYIVARLGLLDTWWALVL